MNWYSFSHYLRPWLLPPGFNILFMALGWCLKYRWRQLGKLISLTGFLSLWLFSTPYIAYHFINLLQNQYALLSQKQISPSSSRNAIVVLGGGDNLEAEYGYTQTVSDFTLHRLNYAAYLHFKTTLPILVSGGKTPGAIHSEADLMSNYLATYYHLSPLYKEDQSFTTADESKLISGIIKENKLNTIYLVTNAWHMPRSVFIFKCAGINVIPAPMGYFVYGPGYGLISFLPNMDALKTSSIAIREFMGLFWYHLAYGHTCVSS